MPRQSVPLRKLAVELGFDPTWMLRLARQGQLKAIQAGNRIWHTTTLEDLAKCLRASAGPGRPTVGGMKRPRSARQLKRLEQVQRRIDELEAAQPRQEDAVERERLHQAERLRSIAEEDEKLVEREGVWRTERERMRHAAAAKFDPEKDAERRRRLSDAATSIAQCPGCNEKFNSNNGFYSKCFKCRQKS